MSEEVVERETGSILRASSLPASLDEVMNLPVAERRDLLERAARDEGPGAVPLLEQVATGPSGPMAVIATGLLGSVRDAAAAAALQRLASSSPREEVRKAARRGLHRLASLGLRPEAQPPATVRAPGGAVQTVYRSMASPIDGGGNRELWIGFERESEISLVGLRLSDTAGIVDAFGTDIARSKFDRESGRLLSDEVEPWVEMPVDYCRHLIEEAHARNAASGTPIPMEYMARRARIGRPEQTYERPLVYSVLNAAQVRWDPRFLDSSGELMEDVLLQRWLLPKEEIADWGREVLVSQRSGIMVAGISQEARVQRVTDAAIPKLFDPSRQALFKRRLEEMAYVLWTLQRELRARQAVAAALAMEPTAVSLVRNPFVRALVMWSLAMYVTAAGGERTKEVRPGVKIHLPY